MGQRLDVGYRHGRHLVRERDVDAAGLHAQAELNRVPVKPQLTHRLDDFHTRQLRLGEYTLARPGRPVEVELPERPRAHRYQRHSLRAIRKPDLYAWLQSLDVNSHCQTLPVRSPAQAATACCRPLKKRGPGSRKGSPGPPAVQAQIAA